MVRGAKLEVALESEKWHWLRFCVEIFATRETDDGQFVEFSDTNSITKKERNGRGKTEMVRNRPELN